MTCLQLSVCHRAPSCRVRYSLLDIQESRLLRIPQHKCEETLGCRNCDAEIDIIAIDDQAALDTRVRRGDLLEREYGHTSERGYGLELDVVFLQDLVPELGPHLYERADVDLVEDYERYRMSCNSFRRSEMRRNMRFTFTRVSFLLPGAAGNGLRSLWSGRGWGGFCLSLWWGEFFFPLLWWRRGGVFGFFNHLVTSFLKILGGVLTLGSSGSICRP